MKRKIILILAAVFGFILSLGIALYPMVSSIYNEQHQSKIHTQFLQQVEDTDDSKLQEALQHARAYNAALNGILADENFSETALMGASEDYDAQLNVTGRGIMGYVSVPKINVTLPIYHGTDSGTLERGIGHLLGTSLPVGGESTHSVLTAHSGMASQRMFSDLPQLKEGDVFYLEVLNETLAYQVDQIKTVLPHDTTYLGIEAEQDLCTLVTCTPFGVNSHRLLVRGHRIPYEEAETIIQQQEQADVKTSSTWQNEYIKGIAIGLGFVIFFLIILLIIWLLRRCRREKKK